MSTHDLARRVRIHSLNMVYRANASHIGSALSIVDIISVLYHSIMRIDKNSSTFINRDRFILSKGHACVAVYAVLAEIGIISYEQLCTYGQDFSILMNHISHKVPGVEFSSGSLGHGLSFGIGKALSAKRKRADWRTFVLMSDGELDEGSNWEAFMFAAHHKLDNLIAIIDYNKLQSLTTVEQTLQIEPLCDKLTAFGWCVHEVDGHNHAKLTNAFETVPWVKRQPSALIAHTIKGKGISFMENKVEWHYRTPNADQLAQAIKELKK